MPSLSVGSVAVGEVLPLIGKAQAAEMDRQIVEHAETLGALLLKMFESAGFVALGFSSWQQYLEDVSVRAGVSTSTLRRHTNLAIAAKSFGVDAGDGLREGVARSITEILSPGKGFTDEDRQEAFGEAVEAAGGHMGDLTMGIASAVSKRRYCLRRAEIGDPDIVSITSRAEEGALAIDDAYSLVRAVESIGDPIVSHVVARMSGAASARTLLNAISTNTGQDIVSTAFNSGYVYVGDRAVRIGDATPADIVAALNTEPDIERKERAADKWRAIEHLIGAARRICADEEYCNIPVVDFARMAVALSLLGKMQAWWIHDGRGAHLDEYIKDCIKDGFDLDRIPSMLFDIGKLDVTDEVIINRAYCIIEEQMR